MSSERWRPLLWVAGLACLGSSANAQTSEYYLTAPAANKIYVVQGGRIVRSWDKASTSTEYMIAIVNTVRTLGYCGADLGAEYTRAGGDLGVRFTHPAEVNCAYDATTDGQYNYAQTVTNGQVYRFSLSWQSPALLFTANGNGRGIAYDRTNNSLWITASGDARLRNYDASGNLLSTLTIGTDENTALGLDPADNTFWLASGNTTLKQYSRTGQLLATLTVDGFGGAIRGGDFRYVGRDCNTNGMADDEETAAGTSGDCDHNGVPDACQAECNHNAVPDACDIIAGTSRDCDHNGVPDECQISAGSTAPGGPFYCNANCSADCNSNGVPDACDADCNSNTTPDACELSAGTARDCNSNGIPDACDIVTGQDCNRDNIPDTCDIAGGTSIDCDTNGVPDSCDPDCNSNSRPDGCDLAVGISLDCNGNHLPDECDGGGGPRRWIGPSGGSFALAANWNPAQVPGTLAQAILSNQGAADNTCVAAAPGAFEFCALLVEAGGMGRQIMEIDAGASLRATGEVDIRSGGNVSLQGGRLNGGTIHNSATPALPPSPGGGVRGFGQLSGTLINEGVIEAVPADSHILTLGGPVLRNMPDGVIRATLGSLVLVHSSVVTQQGRMEVRTQAGMNFDGMLVNQTGGRITLLNGSLGSAGLHNQPGATIDGFGTLDTDVINDGDMIILANLQVLGDVTNNGTITIQSGLLTVTGSISGPGTIVGQFGG